MKMTLLQRELGKAKNALAEAHTSGHECGQESYNSVQRRGPPSKGEVTQLGGRAGHKDDSLHIQFRWKQSRKLENEKK